LQCPTLLNNGFGGHKIEGIGDKHIPWIHNVKNTDMVVAIDDNDCMNIVRLFNDEQGKKYLEKQGISKELIESLDFLGISGIANMLTCIKFAKYYELTSDDVVLTLATDSMEMYKSRFNELVQREPNYGVEQASRDFHRHIMGITTDNMLECNYYDKKRIHNLKYYTWVEQQGKTYKEINEQWYKEDYWDNIHNMTDKVDELIEKFNKDTGVLEKI